MKTKIGLLLQFYKLTHGKQIICLKVVLQFLNALLLILENLKSITQLKTIITGIYIFYFTYKLPLQIK